jgi:hypothetical protein
MTEKPESVTLANYQKANRKMRKGQAKIGFMVHLTAYIGVNTLLITINLLFVPTFYWCRRSKNRAHCKKLNKTDYHA